jgi:hypothetical protein
VSAPGISIREFARRDGCDDKLVRRAIERGNIALQPDGSIDPALVGTGWRRNNRRAEQGADRGALKGADNTPGVRTKVSARTRRVAGETADKPTHVRIKTSVATKRAGRAEAPAKPIADDLVAIAKSPSEAAADIISLIGAPYAFGEAERIKENYLALLRQLEYDTKSAAVVRVDQVAQVFGDACARVRTRLLAIPAELAPELHRKKSVAEIVAVLRRGINEALEELTRGGDGTAAEG